MPTTHQNGTPHLDSISRVIAVTAHPRKLKVLPRGARLHCAAVGAACGIPNGEKHEACTKRYEPEGAIHSSLGIK